MNTSRRSTAATRRADVATTQRVATLHLRGAPGCALADGRFVEFEPKDGLLLAYLALEGPTARLVLGERLWPDADAERARGNLRQRLLRLKRLVGLELVTGGSHPALAPQVVHDLDDTAAVLAPILGDDAGGFAEWLETTRRAHSARHIDALAAASSAAETAGELAAALEHAQSVVALDPLSEHAHRRVMRLHYLRGDVAAARAAYARCAEQLARELGATPASETEALRRQIESGQAPVRPARGPLPVTLLRPPTLIGRAAPLQRLGEAWDGGRAFLLTGEAGIGKSRLLDEFAADRPGAVVVSSRPNDRALPLALLGRLVRQLGGRFPAFAQQPRHAELLMLLPGGAPPPVGARPRRSGVLFGELLGVDGLAGIVVDDLQWADDASLDALREARAMDGAAGVRWGFAGRSGEDDGSEARIERVRSEHGTEALSLAPLDAQSLDDLLRSLQIGPADRGATARRLLAKVGGNPLFVLEVLRQAHSAGGEWDRLEIPERVADLVDRRLQALSQEALMLARVAAVAGTDFSAELAEAVTGLPALALATPWRELEGAHLLNAASFTHDLAQAAAQRSIPEAIAARLHAQVARFLHGASAEPARIARHYLAAGLAGEAVPFLVAAAHRTWLAGCFREGAELYFRAADIEVAAGHVDAAFDILFEATEAASEGGTVDMITRASGLLGQLAHTPVQSATAGYVLAYRYYMQNGDADEFRQRVDDALSLAIAAGAKRMEAECRFAKAHIAAQGGQLNECLQLLAAAETLFRETGPQYRLLSTQSSMATLLGWVGQAERALELIRVHLPAIERSTDRRSLADARMDEALGALDLGRIEQAIAAAESATQLLRSADTNDYDVARIAGVAASVLRGAGEYARALAVLDRSTEQVGPGTRAAGLLERERARLLVDLGRPDLGARALAAYERVAPKQQLRGQMALEIVRVLLRAASVDPVREPNEELDPLASGDVRLACDWVLARGRFPASGGAARQAETLLARCAQQSLVGLRIPLLALAAKLHAELAERDAATRLADQAMPRLGEGIPAWLPSACAWLAKACELLGRPEDARHCAMVGAEWVERAARERVPQEFRDSFRDRNPVNRALRLAASRARLTGA